MDGLKGLLLTHLVELVLIRRIPKDGWNPARRMLCTNSRELLTSMAGKIALNFHPPKGPPTYPAAQHRLVTAWDILWQDYRQINMESYEIVSTMPVKTPEEIDNFWKYFNEVLQKMTPEAKKKFMNNNP